MTLAGIPPEVGPRAEREAGAGGAPAPETRVRGTEVSGQYLATLAMLALLVRDHLDDSTFALLGARESAAAGAPASA